MNVLLIDDERLAREELRGLLADHPDINVIGEAANAKEALALIPKLRPDLIFLDIEMPDRTGFELLEALPPPHPRVIFSTAYNEFALRAFEFNALDYLLKPVNIARLADALNRMRALAAGQPHTDPESPSSTAAPLSENDQVFLRDGDRCWFVPVRSIRFLEAESNYTRVHFDTFKPLLYRTLGSLEERLPANLFLRANRSQIVNLTCIESVGTWFDGALRIKLRGGPEIDVSRRQTRVLRDRLSL